MNATAECNCPFNGECLTPKIIYIFLIMQITTVLLRFSRHTLERYQNYTRDFKHEKYENGTELAKYI